MKIDERYKDLIVNELTFIRENTSKIIKKCSSYVLSSKKKNPKNPINDEITEKIPIPTKHRVHFCSNMSMIESVQENNHIWSGRWKRKKIGKYIRKKRIEKGMTQQQLAEKIQVTEKAVSRWETGRGVPDISLLEPLAEELHVSVTELLNGEEQGAGRGCT